MKKIIAALMLTLGLATISFAQNQFEILVERPNEKSLKGIISQEVLLNDTTFKWYADNLKGYTPNASAIAGLKNHADSVQLVVFMGTWCEDSHNIIPKFYSLLETSGFSKEKVTLIGVDRAKKTLSHLTEALNITNVPTIMVMKNGKEIGRVVEYGKYGLFDKELGEILNKLDN
ncbi:MAG: thioredoxin family protein [Chitinophagaceae bacterium]